VAERLRVCTATVYALCASGALAQVRIVNSIRVREDALVDAANSDGHLSRFEGALR
jgi:hypothetical protein